MTRSGMRKSRGFLPGRRGLFRISLVLCALLMALATGLAFVLKSGWLRAHIAGSLSSGIGHHVAIGEISLTADRKLRIDHVSVPAAAIGKLQNPGVLKLIEIERILVTPKWTTLLDQTIQIEEITLIKPRVAVLQKMDESVPSVLPDAQITLTRRARPPQKTGGSISPIAVSEDTKITTGSGGEADEGPRLLPLKIWELTEAPSDEGQAPQAKKHRRKNGIPVQATNLVSSESGSPAEAPEERPFPPSDPSSPAKTRGLFIQRINKTVTLNKLAIRDGAFDFYTSPFSDPAFSLDGWTADIQNLNSERPKGTLAVTALRTFGFEAATDTRLELSMVKNGTLHFDQLESNILGGSLGGEFQINFLHPDKPIRARLRASGVEASLFPDFPSETLGSLHLASGLIDFELAMTGPLASRDAIRTTGKIKGRNLTIGADQLQDHLTKNWDVKSFEAPVSVHACDFELDTLGGFGIIQNFSVKTAHGIFKSRGFVYPDGALEMTGRAYVTVELIHFIEQLQAGNSPASPPKFLPFQPTPWFTRTQDISIRGDIRNPMADFLVPGKMITLPALITLLLTPNSL